MASGSGKSTKKRGRGSLGFWCAIAIIALIGAYLGVLEASRPHVGGDKLRFDQFVRLADSGDIKDARILNQDAVVVGTYRRPDGSGGRYNAPFLKEGGLQNDLTDLLVRNRVATTIDQQFLKQLVVPITLLLPVLILVVAFLYVILAYRGGTGLFAIRSGARQLQQEKTDVTFADVAGQDAALAELRDVVEFLSAPERFAGLGALTPKGVLLYGPPGCGKTLLARALAGESGSAFYYISGSDFVELYVGVGAARVRDLFREARENVPSIIFIDELDSVGRHRGPAAGATTAGEQEQALNQILTEMDGFDARDGVILIGATNRPDVLDTALLRPGRFDRTVGLERPDEKGRLAILELHARSRRLAAEVDLEGIASRAIGLTGADLANVVNEAALLAGRNHRESISNAELEEGLKRILEAPERQRRLSMRDRSVGRRSTGDKVTFADVAGVEDALDELREIRDYLAMPERFAQMGARAPRGILLAGPPGCGKTLLARAVAGEANAAFFSAAATEFVEVFVGQGAARVRDLFAEAKAAAPAILFLDEIDAVGSRRTNTPGGGGRETDQTLNQILVELDGFEPSTGLLVIAATNRPDILDGALTRSGRFDRQVTIDLPDRAGRREILDIHARGKPLSREVDLDAVAAATQLFSGADLAAVMNEAVLLAARTDRDEVSAKDMDNAIERTMLGVASRRKVMTAEERRMVAYHEAGHALVGKVLPGVTVPHKVSIIPHGKMLGFVWGTDEEERSIHSRSTLINQMAMGLGGRVAEELVFGEPGSGAGVDLQKVSASARKMVCELGMTDALGDVSYTDNGGSDPAEWPLGTRYSEEETRLIGAEVRRLVNEARERASEVLHGSRPTLDRIAAALLERETLSAKELEEIMEEPPLVPAS
ncbi:MAG: AAA family ATPase [Thermoleophilaceae bacterium]